MHAWPRRVAQASAHKQLICYFFTTHRSNLIQFHTGRAKASRTCGLSRGVDTISCARIRPGTAMPRATSIFLSMYGFIPVVEHSAQVGDDSVAAKRAAELKMWWDTRREEVVSRMQGYRRAKKDEAVWISLESDAERDAWVRQLGESLSHAADPWTAHPEPC